MLGGGIQGIASVVSTLCPLSLCLGLPDTLVSVRDCGLPLSLWNPRLSVVVNINFESYNPPSKQWLWTSICEDDTLSEAPVSWRESSSLSVCFPVIWLDSEEFKGQAGRPGILHKTVSDLREWCLPAWGRLEPLCFSQSLPGLLLYLPTLGALAWALQSWTWACQ